MGLARCYRSVYLHIKRTNWTGSSESIRGVGVPSVVHGMFDAVYLRAVASNPRQAIASATSEGVPACYDGAFAPPVLVPIDDECGGELLDVACAGDEAKANARGPSRDIAKALACCSAPCWQHASAMPPRPLDGQGCCLGRPSHTRGQPRPSALWRGAAPSSPTRRRPHGLR